MSSLSSRARKSKRGRGDHRLRNWETFWLRFHVLHFCAGRSSLAIRFRQLGDKSVPTSMNSLDVFWCFGIVTKDLTQLAYLSGQSILGHMRSVPDRVENLFLFDQSAAVLD